MEKKVRSELDIKCKPSERRSLICREEETALCVVGEKENISHSNLLTDAISILSNERKE